MVKNSEVSSLFICTLILHNTAAFFLFKTSVNDNTVTHYVDKNGVKVEKQIKEAIVLHTGFENYTEASGKYNNISSESIDGHNIYGSDDGAQSYTESKDDQSYSEEDYKDASNENISSNPAISEPSSIFDIFTALHTAWREVEKFREKNAKSGSIRNQTEDDRLRRESSVSEKIEPLTPSPMTSISQARYIKGDPLKGYYDFVITEGSYKFWAAFQLATAALVIYSTFAAIYYSKVNPIVGDYEYVDYLGGGRSLSNANIDYQDPTDEKEEETFDSNKKKETQHSQQPFFWLSLLQDGWKSQVGATVRSFFDVIDKLSS